MQSNEFSKNWAQEVEKEEMEKRKKPQIENEVMVKTTYFTTIMITNKKYT